ncbi:MAG: ABC transporter substrate-binding protein [Bacteroidetes bacterium]|nr:ABC transporter substrate-binding protein [Bacteroidota bacterium]MCW5894479.1 ABC transporter substrate-binding protein [Bacteroidota bacterium]
MISVLYRLNIFRRRIPDIFILIIVLCASAESQPAIERSQEAEQQFRAALALFTTGEYVQASAAFERLADRSPVHHRTTAAIVMKAKADLYGGQYNDAEATLQKLLTQFPSSSYKGDAEYTMGLVQLKKQSYTNALREFVACWRTIATRPSQLQLYRLLMATIDSTIDEYISLQELQQVLAATPGGSEREFLLLGLAKKQLHERRYAEATATLIQIEKSGQPPVFPARLNELRQLLEAPREIRIGVLLPLMKRSTQSTREKEVGTGLLDGISFAMQEYARGHHARKVTLDVRDTESDPATAAALFKELVTDGSLLGVIGPAFSSEAIAVRRLANEFRIPTITPTANANGIAESGFFVFQANPDFDTRAKAMARYAVKTLQFKRLAVLASREQPSKSLAEAFAREAEQLGATIITTEWYDRGAADLTQQLLGVRRKANTFAQEPYLNFEKLTQKDVGKLSKLGVSAKILDSLIVRRSVTNAVSLLGPEARSILAENEIHFVVSDPRIDSLQRIVTTIEGLYCPIGSPVEIGVISSQLAYFGIETTLLGSGEWNSIAELNANKRYVRSVLFESDSYTDTRDMRVRDFTYRFSNMFGRMPGRNDFYGYDVTRLVLSALDEGSSTREQLRDALAQVRSYPALHAKISLAPRRVNSCLHILQYTNETIQRVAELEVE